MQRGRAYRFHLRQGVRFHDGRRLTARDVRYSLERVLRIPRDELHLPLPPIRGAQTLRDGEGAELEGFRIVSETEFVIELERPLGFFPGTLDAPGALDRPRGHGRFCRPLA